MQEGSIISDHVERSAAQEWRELSIAERIQTTAQECETKVRPNLSVVVAGCVMVAALVGGAAVAVVELAQVIGVR